MHRRLIATWGVESIELQVVLDDIDKGVYTNTAHKEAMLKASVFAAIGCMRGTKAAEYTNTLDKWYRFVVKPVVKAGLFANTNIL